MSDRREAIARVIAEYGRESIYDKKYQVADAILALPVPEFDYPWQFAPPGTKCAAMQLDGTIACYDQVPGEILGHRWATSHQCMDMGIAPAHWDRTKWRSSLRMMPKEFER